MIVDLSIRSASISRPLSGWVHFGGAGRRLRVLGAIGVTCSDVRSNLRYACVLIVCTSNASNARRKRIHRIFCPTATRMPRSSNSESTATASSHRSRNPRLSEAEKLEQVLQLLSQFRWTLSNFFHILFCLEKPGTDGVLQKVNRSSLHQRMLTSMLDGTTAIHIGEILESIYQNALETSYRHNDDTIPSRGLFSTTHDVPDIKHSSARRRIAY